MPRNPQDPTPEPEERDELGEESSDAEPVSRVVTPIRDEPDHLVFRFEIGPAILAQLLEKLSRIPKVPVLEALDAKYPGFYQLFLRGEPKYIGKTSRPIGARLKEHVLKLRGRTGISLDEVYCRYAFVEDPSLVDVAEGALIDFFSLRGLADWNMSGFGSKAPGHGRGRTAASDWSLLYPPDLTRPVEAGANKSLTLLELVGAIRASSPITFTVPTRYKAAFKAAHPGRLDVPIQTLPFGEWVRLVERHLQPGWRIDRQAVGWYIVND